MTTHTLLAVLALLLLPATALTQTPAAAPFPQVTEARGKLRAACAADVQKFCPNIERGKGERRACLQAHENELSQDCRVARAERAAARSNNKE